MTTRDLICVSIVRTYHTQKNEKHNLYITYRPT